MASGGPGFPEIKQMMGRMEYCLFVINEGYPEDPGIARDIEHEQGDCQGDKDHRSQEVVVKVAQNLIGTIMPPGRFPSLFHMSLGTYGIIGIVGCRALHPVDIIKM